MALDVFNQSTDRQVTEAPRSVGETDRCGLGRILLPTGTLIAMTVTLLAYLHAFGLKTGLDSTSPQYGRYWYSLLAVEALVLTPTVFAVVLRLAKTRCATCAAANQGAVVAPQHHLRHIWTHFGLVLAGGFGPVMLLGAFGTHDAAWHQAVMRDTSLSPTHIQIFFALAPFALGMAIAAFVYGRTRLPEIWSRRSIPMPYVLNIGAWVLTSLFFGFNEFAHTQWINEERTASPIHYPFVMPFWGTLALLAVIVKALPRVGDLLDRAADGGHEGEAA